MLLLINGLGASGQAIRFLEPDLQLAGLTAGQTQPITFQLTNGTDTAIKIQSADASCEWGASAWGGMVLVRLLSPSPEKLRAAIVTLLQSLRGRDAPRVWQ